MRGLLAFGIMLAALTIGPAASLHAESLTATRVAAMAATQSPRVLLATTQVDEARGRLSGAHVLAVDNPVLEGVRSVGEDEPESELEMTLPLGFGLRRSYRIAQARAGLDREEFLEADARVQSVAAALSAYFRVLHADQGLAIAVEQRQVADELVSASASRLEAGDGTRLELLVAETERSRAESEMLASRRFVAETRLDLANVLGLAIDSELEVAGELGDRSILDAAIMAAPKRRSDLLAAESDFQSTKAAVSGANAAWLPDVALRMKMTSVGDEETLSPGLAMSLPLFNRGQGLREESLARREGAAIRLRSLESLANAEAKSARIAYESMSASARELQERALPRALEVGDLSRQSYVAGKMDLAALLVVRGTALAARRETVDRLLEAALTGVALTVALGATPE